MTTVFRLSGLSACLALAITGCSQGFKPPPERGPAAGTVSGAAMGSEKVVNVYNWADFIAPSVISAFQKEYGIQVNYDVFDSNDQLETKLLTGHANYDVVVPGGGFLERVSRPGFTRSSTRRSCRT
jgi:spermidine/putrescine-binding protein